MLMKNRDEPDKTVQWPLFPKLPWTDRHVQTDEAFSILNSKSVNKFIRLRFLSFGRIKMRRGPAHGSSNQRGGKFKAFVDLMHGPLRDLNFAVEVQAAKQF